VTWLSLAQDGNRPRAPAKPPIPPVAM